MEQTESTTRTRAPVSFVIPVYNGEKYVAEAIESCLAQTWLPMKVVVVDDASTDGTRAIVSRLREKYNPVVESVFLPVNGGRSVARNAGIERVSTPYCLFLDADDMSEPDRVEKQFRFMESHPEVFASSGFVRYIDRNGRVFASGSLSVLSRQDYERAMSTDEPIGFFSPATIVRTSVFKEDGLWFRPVFRQAQDIDLWNRISERHIIFAHPDFVTQYRIHDEAVSTRKYLRSLFFFEYIRDCISRRRIGTSELSLDAFSEKWANRPFLKKVAWRCSAESRRSFRMAGFNFAERRFGAFLIRLAIAFVLNPFYAIRKTRGKLFSAQQ